MWIFNRKKPESRAGILGGAKGRPQGGKRKASWSSPWGGHVTAEVIEKQTEISGSLKVRGLTMKRTIQMEEQREAESKATG